MKYLLADAIVYNDEDGSVSLINVPPEMRRSSPAQPIAL
jgi:hypothetical protein